MQSPKQIYIAKNLHIHPHYSISLIEITQIVNSCAQCNIPHKVYGTNQSYLNDFIIVINCSTQEWSDALNTVHSEIFQIPFHEEEFMMNSKRNNYQINAGFCSQSFSSYTFSKISEPKMLSITKNPFIIKSMEFLTKVIDILYYHRQNDLIHNLFNNQERNEIFSNKISILNRIEGLTIATYKSHDLLHYHIDNNNCRVEGYNYVIGVSKCDFTTRRVFIGYGKKVCNDYFLRLYRYVFFQISAFSFL